jgi:hypothetical protein
MITPTEYDARLRGIDVLAGLLTRFRGDEMATIDIELGAVLSAAAEVLGLPEEFTLADLDQAIAGLKDAALADLEVGDAY